jgi:hypothetical protein
MIDYFHCKCIILSKNRHILLLIQKLENYLKNHIIHDNHVDYLLYLELILCNAIIKSKYSDIRNTHSLFLSYIDNHILPLGIMKNAYEHDCLDYQIRHLNEIMRLITLFHYFGFYKFNYVQYKNAFQTTIIHAFEYLYPYLSDEKIHYMYIGSIFKHDMERPEWGSIWDKNKAIVCLTRNKHFHSKIEQIYNKVIYKQQDL